MSILVNLIGDSHPVFVDERSANLGGSFYLNPDLQVYSPLPMKWAYDQLIRYPSATLLDVGSSTGCFSLLSRHHPDLKVYAFEPVLLTYVVLRENIHLNSLNEQVQAYNVAVSNYDGKGTLHTVIDDAGKGVSIVDGSPAAHKAVEDSEIEVMTIDAFCALHDIRPTMIKIDTEGQEKFVLEGAKRTIEKYKPFLLFEYSQENANQYSYNIRDTIEMIETWDYTWTSPEGLDIWAVPIGWEELIK